MADKFAESPDRKVRAIQIQSFDLKKLTREELCQWERAGDQRGDPTGEGKGDCHSHEPQA
jgi:hypothetical protein